MKNLRYKIIPAFLSAALLFGCGSSSDEQFSSITETEVVSATVSLPPETEAAAESSSHERVTANTAYRLTATETLSPEESRQQVVEAGFGIDGVSIYCGSYDVPEFREEFAERLSQWRENNDIVSQITSCAVIDDYIIISDTSGEFAGNTQTSYVIVDCGDRIVEIDAGEIYNISPIYFIGNDVLYCYNDSLSAGFYHHCLSEFSLISGEKINEYHEAYSLGSEDKERDPESTYPDINDIDELKSYIYSISPQWYRLDHVFAETFDSVPDKYK